jgi:hypothetical protein
MTNIFEYLMQNNKYVIGLTIISLALKFAFPYINLSPEVIKALTLVRTVFNWVMAIAFINFMAFFILAIFYRPKVVNPNTQKLFAKWLPILKFTLPIMLYGGVIYMAANNTWTEIAIFIVLVFLNQWLFNKMKQRNGY